MQQLLLKADRLIVRADEPPVSNGAVLIENKTILAAGRSAQVEARAAPSAVIRAFPGGTLLPGLIDAHVHLAFDGTETAVEKVMREDDATQVLAMAGRAQQLLRSGVTSVRDLGDRNGLAIRLREAVNSGAVPGPRIQAAGSPVTITGGHCWFLGGEADGIDDIRRVVRRNFREGADVVKVMAGGGNITAESVPMLGPQFSTEELRVVAEEARRFGKPSAAHSHNAESTARAVEAGIECIEHCGWNGPTGELDRRPEVMEMMRRNGTYVSPTIGAVMTKPPYDAYAPMVIDNLKWYREMGIKLIGSTDAGTVGTGFDEYATTFPLWLEAGFSASELLTILTLNAAEALQLGDRTGQLAPGFDADVIVVEGDPLGDIAALERVSWVVAQGRPLPGGSD